MNDREVELIDYLRVLWRQKWIIIVTVVAAVVAAWAAGRTTTPTYQTETGILLLPPLSSQLDAEAVGSRLAPEAYQELAVSTALLEAVIEEAALGESASVSSLKGRISVSVQRLSSEGELLLTMRVRGAHPDQLVDIATAWTAAFTELYGELFQDRIARSYEYINRNYAETESELRRLASERTELLLGHPVSILQADLSALQSADAANRSQLANARRNYELGVAQLAALEKEFAGQPLAFRLSQAIEPDALVAALGAGLSAREIEALMQVRVETEEVNATYVNLNTKIATLRATLAELAEEVRIREAEAVALRSDLEAVQRELTEAEATRDELSRRIGLLETAYAKLSESLQEAKIALAETPEPIRVIDEPLVPRSSTAPRKTTNIAIAGFLGLMLGTLLAFFVDYLARVRANSAPPRSVRASEEQLGGQHADEDAKRGGAEDGQHPQAS